MNNLTTIQPTDTTGVERAKNVELYYSDSAVVRAKISAPEMVFHHDTRNPHREFPKGIKVLFYNESAQVTSQLAARYATQSDRDRNVLLRDSVVVWNKRNERLETEELLWKEIEQTISSTKQVKITTPTEAIHGVGFNAKTDFTNWQIFSVQGRIRSQNFLQSPF